VPVARNLVKRTSPCGHEPLRAGAHEANSSSNHEAARIARTPAALTHMQFAGDFSKGRAITMLGREGGKEGN